MFQSDRAKYEESKRSSLTKLVVLDAAWDCCAVLSIVGKINVSELPSFRLLAEKKVEKNMYTKAKNSMKKNFLD